MKKRDILTILSIFVSIAMLVFFLIIFALGKINFTTWLLIIIIFKVITNVLKIFLHNIKK
jgi:hypothetical protein